MTALKKSSQTVFKTFIIRDNWIIWIYTVINPTRKQQILKNGLPRSGVDMEYEMAKLPRMGYKTICYTILTLANKAYIPKTR